MMRLKTNPLPVVLTSPVATPKLSSVVKLKTYCVARLHCPLMKLCHNLLLFHGQLHRFKKNRSVWEEILRQQRMT